MFPPVGVWMYSITGFHQPGEISLPFPLPSLPHSFITALLFSFLPPLSSFCVYFLLFNPWSSYCSPQLFFFLSFILFINLSAFYLPDYFSCFPFFFSPFCFFHPHLIYSLLTIVTPPLPRGFNFARFRLEFLWGWMQHICSYPLRCVIPGVTRLTGGDGAISEALTQNLKTAVSGF